MTISKQGEERLKGLVAELERVFNLIKSLQPHKPGEIKQFLNREEAQEFVAMFDRKKKLLDEIHSIVLGKPEGTEF